MKVMVNGHGYVNFPGSMSEKDVRAVLKQFEPKKDDTLPKAIKALEKAVRAPQVVVEQKIVEVEKQVIVKEYEKIPAEKVVEKVVKVKPKGWHFTITRNDIDNDITDIYAKPLG